MKRKESSALLNCLKIFKLVWKFDKKTVSIIYLLLTVQIVLDVAIIWTTASFVNTITTGTVKSIYDKVILGYFALYVFLPAVAFYVWSWRAFNFDKLNMMFQQHTTDVLLLNKRDELDIQTHESPNFASMSERVNSNSGKLFFIWEDILLAYEAFLGLLISAVVFIFYKWWFLVILVLAILPDLYLEIKLGKKKWGIWNLDAETRKKYYDTKNSFNQLSKILDIKLYGIGNYFKNILSSLIGSFNKEVIKLEKDRTIKRNYTRTLLLFVVAGLTFVMMRDVILGTILVGTFIFYTSRLANFRHNLINMFREFGKIASDNPFVNDIFEFLDTKKVIKNGKEKLDEETPRVEFRGGEFQVPRDREKYFGRYKFKNCAW